MKTLLLGTVLTTGVTLFSVHQIKSIPPSLIHADSRPGKHTAAPHHVKVAHHKVLTPSGKLAKRKSKPKPYFLARAANS
jgi:hypothetical protein